MNNCVLLLKFAHVLFALILFGLVLFNFMTQLDGKKNPLSMRTDQISLLVALFLLVTASFLVTPEGYTFTTPWINAAFILLTFVMLQLSLAWGLKRKNNSKKMATLNYGLILILLMVIIHDAVSKHTVWS